MNRGPNEMPTLDSKARGEAPTAARLQYTDALGISQDFPLTTAVVRLGRGEKNDVDLRNMEVSRKHAEILFQNGRYLLKDLASKLGTCVNGVRMEQAELRHGDRIQLGGPQGQLVTFSQGDLLDSMTSLQSWAGERITVRNFKELGALISTIIKLNSISIMDELMCLVVDTAIEITGAERGFILVKDENNSLRFQCARDARKQSLDASFIEASRRVPEQVIETGMRKIIADLDDISDQNTHTSTKRAGIKSIACVPLRYVRLREFKGSSSDGFTDILGVLYTDSPHLGMVRSDAQIEALETLAWEAATAIYNARLYRIALDKQRMERDLAIARTIQQGLLPPATKVYGNTCACSLNLPCWEVGGDYFDYFDLKGETLGFAVGDVSGKGVPAALMAAKVQGIFSAQTLFEMPMQAMIAQVNRYLTARRIENAYITFFFGTIDPEGNCSYTNAGHNPPVLVRQDGSLSELSEGGTVLGLFPGVEYESRTVRLNPGDHVVLYTDGAVEARNTAGEEFGKDRLHALLKQCSRCLAAEILARLHDEVVAFSFSAPQHDDITMMVVGYGESDV